MKISEVSCRTSRFLSGMLHRRYAEARLVLPRVRGIKSRLMNEQSSPLDNPVNSPDSSRHATVTRASARNLQCSRASPPREAASRRGLGCGWVGGLGCNPRLGVCDTPQAAGILPNTIQPLAAYAANLPLSQLAMSESNQSLGREIDLYRRPHPEHRRLRPSPALPSRCSSATTSHAAPGRDPAALPDPHPRALYRYPARLRLPARSRATNATFALSSRSIPGNWNYPNARDPHHSASTQNRCLDPRPGNSYLPVEKFLRDSECNAPSPSEIFTISPKPLLSTS